MERNIIRIDDTWGLEIAPMNIIITHEHLTEKGNVCIVNVGYYATLEGAVLSLHDKMVQDGAKSGHIQTVYNLLTEIQLSQNKLRFAVSGIKKEKDPE